MKNDYHNGIENKRSKGSYSKDNKNIMKIILITCGNPKTKKTIGSVVLLVIFQFLELVGVFFLGSILGCWQPKRKCSTPHMKDLCEKNLHQSQ